MRKGMGEMLQEGWINGITAEVGTLLGPNTANQFFTVKEVDIAGKRVLVRRATPQDTMGGYLNAEVITPRSTTEAEFTRIRPGRY